MLIRISECNSFNASSLFRDLANYENVNKWIEAYIDDKAEINFIDFHMKINNKTYVLCSAGFKESKDELQKIVKIIKKLPRSQRIIPNDTMEITCDLFESELFIKLK